MKKRKLPDTGCVLKVGDGRGFIVVHRVKTPPLPKVVSRKHSGLELRQVPFMDHRLVVTAAHCLPKLPPPHAMAYGSERTYQEQLGNLDGTKKGIWAKCLFADPVADIAVLGTRQTIRPTAMNH